MLRRELVRLGLALRREVGPALDCHPFEQSRVTEPLLMPPKNVRRGSGPDPVIDRNIRRWCRVKEGGYENAARLRGCSLACYGKHWTYRRRYVVGRSVGPRPGRMSGASSLQPSFRPYAGRVLYPRLGSYAGCGVRWLSEPRRSGVDGRESAVRVLCRESSGTFRSRGCCRWRSRWRRGVRGARRG